MIRYQDVVPHDPQKNQVCLPTYMVNIRVHVRVYIISALNFARNSMVIFILKKYYN